uniref:RVP domain-containing protein n=1 Tax=Caenorhabditis japonica TaxID=281687 RepID=A0A8R1IPD7_CAEJA
MIGESLLVSKCREVKPSTVHWNRKVNNTCYDLVPVTIDEETWFQLPGSEDLVGEAVIIPCEDRPDGIHMEHHRWLGADNREAHPQQFLRPNKMTQAQFLLEPPKTFYTTMNQETGASTGVDKENEARSSRYQRDLQRTLLKEGILNDGLEIIKETTEKASKSAKDIYNFTIGNIQKGLRHVFFSTMHLLLWISLPTLVIFTLGCVIYGYLKYRAFRATCKLSARATQSTAKAIYGLAHHININNVQMEDRQQRPNIRRPIRQEYPEVRVNAVRSSLVRAAKLPHIEVELQGRKINALFDTGAAVSYLPISSVPTDIETGHQPTAKAANGSSLQFLGTCKAILRIGEIFVPHTFLVSSDLECPAPLLIGSDIIEKINKNGHDVNFNLFRRQLTIG